MDDISMAFMFLAAGLLMGCIGGIIVSDYILNERGNVIVDGFIIGSSVPESAKEDIETLIIEKYPDTHTPAPFDRWFPLSSPPTPIPTPTLTPIPITQKECWCREVIP